MSTDFYIKLSQLRDKGLIDDLESYTAQTEFEDEFGNITEECYHGTHVKFAGYTHYRDCDVDGNELHISCSGSFRVWLRDYLTLNNVEFKEY